MEKQFGSLIEASWKYLLTDQNGCSGLATFVGDHKMAVNFINGDVVVFGNSTVGGVGAIKWRLVIEGDADADRYVEMMVKRAAITTNAAAGILDHDIIWSTFTSAGSSGLLTTTKVVPSGFKTLGLRNTGETNFETVGPIRAGKFTAELLCDDDSEKRYVSRNIVKVSVECDIMDTSPTSLAVLDTFGDVASNDLKITFTDNQIFTAADFIGTTYKVENQNDADGNAIWKFKGEGVVLTSGWAALWS
jgi:hypothetical protein